MQMTKDDVNRLLKDIIKLWQGAHGTWQTCKEFHESVTETEEQENLRLAVRNDLLEATSLLSEACKNAKMLFKLLCDDIPEDEKWIVDLKDYLK